MTVIQSNAGDLPDATLERVTTQELILLQTRRRCNPDIQNQIDRFASAALRHQTVVADPRATRAETSRKRIARRVGNLLYLSR